MSKKIWLIRHGESEANAGHATVSPDSIALTANGQAQAMAVAHQMQGVVRESGGFITSIVVSPYVRTRQTAQPLIHMFPNTPVQEWPIQEYTYLSPKACENTTILQRRPMIDEYWSKADPTFVHGDGAESFNEFAGRVTGALSRISALPDGNYVMFCHAQFIKGMLLSLALGPLFGSFMMLRFRQEESAAPIIHAQPLGLDWFDRSSALDRANASTYTAGDLALLSKLEGMLTGALTVDVPQIQDAVRNCDYALAEKLLHRNKPSIQMLCKRYIADASSDALKELSLAASAGVAVCWPSLTLPLARLMQALQVLAVPNRA
jgi:broad specificity phosphatase PhoE